MRNSRALLKRFLGDRQGTTAILFGLMAIPAMSICGGAIDFGTAYNAREKLQASADAAALGAASMGSEATPDQKSAMALALFNANSPTMRTTVSAPTITVGNSSVALNATASVTTSLLGLIGINTIDIHASSTAAFTTKNQPWSGAKICMLALDPDNANGIHIQGRNNIQYPGCWAHTNSTQATSVNSNGSVAVATGAGTCTVGGVSDPAGDFTPTPNTSCSTVADPFATVSAYATSGSYTPTFRTPSIPSSCASNNLNLKKGNYTLSPGRYCGGININAQATVTFQAGIYIIDGGVLNVQSGASASGSNLLFYFTGDDATLTVIGGGSIDLSGRTTESSYAGFLFIAKPGASTTQVSNIQGGGTLTLTGLLYMPFQTVYVTGNGDVNATATLFGMIARNFDFRGNGDFRLVNGSNGGTVPNILPAEPTVTTITSVRLQ